MPSLPQSYFPAITNCQKNNLEPANKAIEKANTAEGI